MDKARIIELIKIHEESLEVAKGNFYRIDGALNMLKSQLKEIEKEEEVEDAD
jgi:hypothetical protein